MTIIKLVVSEQKNLNHLNKLSEDPFFIYSILKMMGYKKCPNDLCLKISLFEPKKEKESVSDSNINDK